MRIYLFQKDVKKMGMNGLTDGLFYGTTDGNRRGGIMGTKRTSMTKVLLTGREKEIFKKLADNNGISLSSLIRILLLEKSREKETVKRF